MSIKPYAKPYNIMQYIRLDEYVTLSELSEKTNTGVPTIKKQLAKLREALSNTGYKISSCNKGIKLIKGDSDYLPVDLIFFNSQEFDFITNYMQFIISGLSDYSIFNKMYSDKFYTDRQVKYFFKSNLNMTFSEFKGKSNFEHFSLFVEYCVLWCSCRNIKKLFNEYISIEHFNELMFAYPQHQDISANNYMTIYSCLVFDKINNKPINNKYQRLQQHFKYNKYISGFDYYKQIVTFTQTSFPNDALLHYYCKVNNLKCGCLSKMYNNLDQFSYELMHLQANVSTKVVSEKKFTLNLIYEGSTAILAVTKGALKKNYPNITIICIPSWLYLYGNLNLTGMSFSNAIIDEKIHVLKVRDEESNYNLDI
ncbi:hypothetical protein RZE82_08725 [Mollicutes bacterium LVI A0039]|nr:hypothetical protein RZE82_08725 [Mollicutes bacterium LVI A0039]